MVRKYLYLNVGLVLLLIQYSFAQKTVVYQEELATYKTALELFDKAKYGVAQKHFELVVKSIEDSESELRVNSEYYRALCALELFNKDAEHLLEQFVSDHPESPQVKIAYFQLGRYNYRKRKWAKVINWFDRVDEFDLDKEELVEYQFKKGYSYFMLENYAASRKLLYELKDVDTKYTAPARFYYGHIAYDNKEYQTSLEEFEKIKTDDKFSKIIPYYITQIYYVQEKYEELIAYAPALLDTATPKRVPEISRLLGDAYYRTENFEAAIPYLEKHASSVYDLSISDLYQLGFAYYKNGEFDKAISKFSKISQEQDSIAQVAFYHLGDCYLKSNKKNFARTAFLESYKMDFDKQIQEDALYNYALLSYDLSYDPYNKSIDAFKEFIEKYPNSEKSDEAYGYLLNVYMTTRNYKAAMESLESISSLDPRLKEAYQRVAYNSAVETYHNGFYLKAIEGFQKAMKYPMDKELNTASRFWIGESFYQLKNYQKAIEAYQVYIYEPGAILQKDFNLVNYNLGYSYFNLDDFDNAIKWFRKYVGYKNESDTVKLTDANLRIGDAYFLQKDYYKAEGFYNDAAKLKGIDPDYALYQSAIAFGLLKKQEEKLNTLQELVSEYPSSQYIVDAKYQLALGAIQKGDSRTALGLFEELTLEFPNSSYVKKALTNIGQIHFNNGDNEKALGVFRRIVDDYPNYADAKEALHYIETIYVRLGEVEEYASYMEGLEFVNVTNAKLDSVMYTAAQIQYLDGSYSAAKNLFEKYLSKFDKGLYLLEAHFYKGECEMRERNYSLALIHYNYVIEAAQSEYLETALVNASRINFSNLDFEAALSNYILLEKVADFKSNIKESQVGQMKSFFFLKNYSSAITYAQKVLLHDKIRNSVKVESNMIIGKSALAMDSLEFAIAAFDTTASLTDGELGAEATYYKAMVFYRLDSLELSEAEVYNLVNRVPSYQFWVAKGLILLSDIYVKMGDNFQAKATLQSIIDNYDGGGGLVEEAMKKIEVIDALENISLDPANEEEIEIEYDEIDESELKELFESEDEELEPKDKGDEE